MGQNPQIPQPDDWHLMQEMKGVPVVGIDWEKEFPHIVQSVKGGDLVRVQLLSGVTAQEIDKLIDAMLLDGYTVRMGNHELGISGNRATDNFRNGRLHLHIEQTELEEYDQTAYVSYVLDIDASQIVQGKNNQGIAATYRKLFGRYISSDNALYQIR
ncbi:MAG: hypothetical protein J6U96_01640 [Elusimicrobiaceae bacterium]|nr:hypothetical protein [Elusimicrobiaceae bacterium]